MYTEEQIYRNLPGGSFLVSILSHHILKLQFNHRVRSLFPEIFSVHLIHELMTLTLDRESRH